MRIGAMKHPRTVSSRRMGWILGLLVFICVSLLLYTVWAFFRMDQVNDERLERFWSVQVMACAEADLEPVLAFSSEKNGNIDFLLRYSRSLLEHLKKQPDGKITVNRRLAGYLTVWDTGVTAIQAVAGKKVLDSWLLPNSSLHDCSVRIDEKAQQKLLLKRIKMHDN